MEHSPVPSARLLRAGTFAVLLSGCIPWASAQVPWNMDFAGLIRTSAGIQSVLERCDGHPEFETALANWLEMANPVLPADQHAVHETSIRLLEDTTDPQIALALSDGLFRRALQDLKRDASIVPKDLARRIYAELRKATKNHQYKRQAMMVTLYGITEDGTVVDANQASFVQAFLTLAQSGATRSDLLFTKR